MDLFSFLSGAQASPPNPPVSPSVGYPYNGSPTIGVAPTVLGDYWVYQIAEELRAVLAAGSIVPSAGNLTQLLSAIKSIYSVGAVLSKTIWSANGNYAPHPSMQWIEVEVQGSSASSGGAPATGANQVSGSGGSGGGGYCRSIYTRAQIMAALVGGVIPITIGAGGAQQGAGLIGVTGGVTSFGSLMSSTSGFPGAILSATTETAAILQGGGQGGVAAGGNVVNANGIRGGDLVVGVGLSTNMVGGVGGGSPLYGGAGGGHTNFSPGAGTFAGNSATCPGAGPSSRINGHSQPAGAGVAGMRGEIWVWEYA